MANTDKTSSGFTLPPPTGNADQPIQSTTGASPIRIDIPAHGASSRDILVGGAILIVLMVAFFFAKNAYANMLVARRVEPRAANAAGWWLWVFLSLLSVGVVLAAVSRSTLMAPFIVGPLGVGALVSMVLMLVSGRR